MSAARGIALSALVLAVLLAGYLLLFRGGGGHEYTLRVPDGGPARQGRRRPGRRPADRLRALDRAHRRQPRGRQGQGRGALRAAARGHPRRDPAHLAVGHRQPLRRAHARARHQPAARRRRHACDLSATTSVVDLDQVFNTIDKKTRGDLQDVIKGFATQYEGKSEEVGQSAKYFNPLLSTSRVLADQVTEDEGALTRFLVNSSRAVTAVAERRDDLSGAGRQRERDGRRDRRRERGARRARCELLPTTLRRANTTFVNLRATLDDLDVLVAESKPATKDLAPFLRELRPLVRDARPTIRDLSTLIAPRRPRQRPRRGDAQDAGAAARRHAAPSAAAAPRSSARSRCSSSSAPTRPTSSAGCATSARARRTTTPTATSRASSRSSTRSTFTDNPAGGVLTPIPPSQRFDGLETGVLKRCPGAASQRPAGQLGALHRQRQPRPDDCDPSLVLPGP